MSPLDAFLDRLLRDREDAAPIAMAVQSETVPDVAARLRRTRTGPTLSMPEVIPRAWIGNRIRVAPHYDLMENIGVVVAGRRRFTLFPPDQLPNLYAGPVRADPGGNAGQHRRPAQPRPRTIPAVRGGAQMGASR